MEEEKKLSENIEEIEAVTENEEEKIELTPQQEADKKIKNLISAVILLSGLFLGSLFVDAVQMVRGGGFSERALSKTDVVTAAGKTWVAYEEPIVKIQVISDDSCEKCSPDEVLVGLKQVLPTMLNEKIDVNSEAGQKLVAQFNLKTIPAFIFSKEVEKTELFEKAEPVLDKQGDAYAIKSAEAGFPVGKYIAAPSISEKDIVLGSKDAKVKIVAFGDFQNPADKQFFQTIMTPLVKEYGDKVQVAFKGYVPPASLQGTVAALGAACANEQGKFMEFAEKLFATQTAWSKAKDASASIKTYGGQIGLNAADFGKCVDEKRYQDLTTQNLQDGQAFGLQATPAIFIGSDMQLATAKFDDMKKIIDEQLAK